MKKIEIEIPDGKEAKWVSGVLALVDAAPKDITERIKTFEDAYNWCFDHKKQHLCRQFINVSQAVIIENSGFKDVLAYLKLRIITAALNEGWEPTFEKEERRWYGWYDIVNGSLIDMYPCSASDDAFSGFATRLSFKSKKLAEYAATQFKDIYMDFCYKGKG